MREHQLVLDLHPFVFEAETPSIVVPVEETRAHRVLANLLTNAIKYSPEGGPVRVTIKQSDGPDGKVAVLVVRDEGLGIPQDDLAYVFDRFHRGANVVGRFAGTGIGLASARELVELYGGTISVESEEGKGSTFVVSLPLAPPTSAAATYVRSPHDALALPPLWVAQTRRAAIDMAGAGGLECKHRLQGAPHEAMLRSERYSESPTPQSGLLVQHPTRAS